MGKTIGVVLALKDKCSPAIVGIAQKFGMAEAKAKSLNQTLRNQAKQVDGALKGALQGATAVIGATVGAVTMLTNKTMQYGDRIDKLSQKIGISRKGFQEWDYILSQNGSSVENLQMGYKTLAVQMNKARSGSKESVAIFSKLGVAVKDNTGALRSQESVFNDTVKALQNIKNPTEKTIMAQKLFGKSAIELKPLLNQSAESVENLRKKANALGLVMSDNAVDGAVKLTDTMDTLRRSFGAIGLGIGVSMIPAIQQLSDQMINNLPQIQTALIPVMSNFADIVGFTCLHLDIIIPAVVSLAGAFGLLNVVTAVTGFIAAFCNPVGLAVTAIAGLVAGLGVAYVKFEGFRNGVNATFGAIKTMCQGLVELIRLTKEYGVIGGVIVGGVKLTQAATLKHNALGTSYFGGGTTVVGEYGPELVNLPRGTQVMSNNQTQQAMSGDRNVTVNLNVAGNVLGNREFFNEMITMMASELRTVMP